MTQLFVMREKILQLYREYETWFNIIFKFIGMMFVFGYISSRLDYIAVLGSLPVTVVLSLVCSLLPSSGIVIITCVVVFLQLFKMSAVLSLVILVVMLMLYFLFLRFSPKQNILLLAVPVLISFKLQFIIPLLAGVLTPFAIIPSSVAVVMVKLIGYAQTAAVDNGIGGTTINMEGILKAFQGIADSMLSDREIWLYIIVFAAGTIVVYLISRLAFDYSWYAAVITGALVTIVIAFMGEIILGVSAGGIAGVVAGTVAAAVIALIVQFFRCVVDYTRKEYTQFEDDDYYYYVKAVPKISVAQPDKNVEVINPVYNNTKTRDAE